jgi:hypothetical protein
VSQSALASDREWVETSRTASSPYPAVAGTLFDKI